MGGCRARVIFNFSLSLFRLPEELFQGLPNVVHRKPFLLAGENLLSEAAEAVPERRSSKIETPVSEESVMKEDAGKRLLARVLFCACAEARSLTKGRKTLGLHAEEAETLLNALTREAAEPLFRVTNGVFTLTEAGIQRFRKWKEPASSLYQADPVSEEEPGYESLAVSVPTTTGATLLSPLIVRFAESRPGLRIDIRLTHGTYHPLWEGVDLRVGHGEYFMEDVETHPLGALTRICVAAPEYLEANGTPENPEDLERHLFFGPKDAVDPGFLTFTRGKSVRRVQAESRVSLRSYLSALFCALSGGYRCARSRVPRGSLSRLGEPRSCAPAVALSPASASRVYRERNCSRGAPGSGAVSRRGLPAESFYRADRMKKSLIPDTWLMLLQLEELGSFSKVGERRGIAPSSVKRRLDDLQSRFDQPIYRAEPTGVFFTAFGTRLAAGIRTSVKTLLESDEKPEPVTLTVFRDPRVAAARILPLFSKAAEEGAVSFSLTVSEADRESADLAITARIADGTSPRNRIASVPWVLTASPGLIRRTGVPYSPEDFSRIPVIFLQADRAMLKSLELAGKTARTHFVPDMETGIMLAKSGAGIFFGADPGVIEREIRRNELTVVPFFKGIELQIAAEANPAARKLIPELRSLFEEYGKGCGGEN